MKFKIALILLVIAGNLKLEAQTIPVNLDDSVKKYIDIYIFYSANGKNMLADVYGGYVDKYQRKIDSINNMQRIQIKQEKYTLDKQKLEAKYKIKLP